MSNPENKFLNNRLLYLKVMKDFLEKNTRVFCY